MSLSMLAGIPTCVAMLQYPLRDLAHAGDPPMHETLGLLAGAGVLLIVAVLLRSTRPRLPDLMAVVLGMLVGWAGTFGVFAGYIVAAMMFL